LTADGMDIAQVGDVIISTPTFTVYHHATDDMTEDSSTTGCISYPDNARFHSGYGSSLQPTYPYENPCS
jgi:hypothetical protein